MRATRDNWLPTRRSLLSRLKNWEDNESWRDFFNTYSRLLYTVAAKSGFTDAEAQDIVQETIISVAKHIPDFKYDPARGSFKNWLLNIARCRIVDYVRRRQRQPRREEAHTTQTAQTAFIQRIPDPTPAAIDKLWEEEWHKQVFDAALERVKKQVSAKEFQIFDCVALRQWAVKDVAAALRVSEAHVYTAKSRVAALLKKEVREIERQEA